MAVLLPVTLANLHSAPPSGAQQDLITLMQEFIASQAPARTPSNTNTSMSAQTASTSNQTIPPTWPEKLGMSERDAKRTLTMCGLADNLLPE